MMLVEKNVPLQHSNSFGIVAKALSLVRLGSQSDLAAVLQDSVLKAAPKFVLGGGSQRGLQRFRPERQGADHAGAVFPAQGLEARAGLCRHREKDAAVRE